KSAIEIVLLYCGQALRGRTERLAGIQFVSFFEVGLGFIVVGQLRIEHAARQVEGRGGREDTQAVGQHVDADLEGLMTKGDVGEIEIEVYVVRIENDGLAQSADGLRSVPGVFVGGGGQFQRFSIGIFALEQRLQCDKGILRLVSSK